MVNLFLISYCDNFTLGQVVEMSRIRLPSVAMSRLFLTDLVKTTAEKTFAYRALAVLDHVTIPIV